MPPHPSANDRVFPRDSMRNGLPLQDIPSKWPASLEPYDSMDFGVDCGAWLVCHSMSMRTTRSHGMQ